MADDDQTVRIVTIVTLGVILLASVIGITITAVLTDRNMARAEALTFGGIVVVAGLGGLSWWTIRRRRWHLRVDHNGNPEENNR